MKRLVDDDPVRNEARPILAPQLLQIGAAQLHHKVLGGRALLADLAEETYGQRGILSEKCEKGVEVIGVLVVMSSPDGASVSNDKRNSTTHYQSHALLCGNRTQPRRNVGRGGAVRDLSLLFAGSFGVFQNTLCNRE
jgi:hypothetical protein